MDNFSTGLLAYARANPETGLIVRRTYQNNNISITKNGPAFIVPKSNDLFRGYYRCLLLLVQ